MVSRTEAEGRAGATGPDFVDEAGRGEPGCGTRGRRRRRGAGERRRQDAEAWKGGLSALRVRGPEPGTACGRVRRTYALGTPARSLSALAVPARRPHYARRRNRRPSRIRPPRQETRGFTPPPRCRVAFVPLPRGHRPRDPIPRPLPAPAPPLRRLGPDSDFLAKNTLVYAPDTAKTA